MSDKKKWVGVYSGYEEYERNRKLETLDNEDWLKKAQEEISQSEEYNYFVVNDVFEEALTKLKAIVTAERVRKERMKKLLHGR